MPRCTILEKGFAKVYDQDATQGAQVLYLSESMIWKHILTVFVCFCEGYKLALYYISNAQQW